MDEFEKEEKITELRVVEIIQDYLQNSGFTDRKLTDSPSDNLQVVNRKYVNLNGTTANRPISSVIGQQYFDTMIGRPVFRKDNGSWVDGAGSIS